MDEQQPLTQHQLATVRAVTASLKPVLADICQRLDRIDEGIRAIMARQRLARPKPHTAAKPCTHKRPRTPRARTCRGTGRY